MPQRILTALFLAPVLTASLAGHDFWIRPSQFDVSSEDLVSVKLMVGDAMRGDSLPRTGSHINQFFARGPGGDTDILGREGADPVGFLRVSAAGSYSIAYSSEPTVTVLGSAQFERYLKEEGLETIIRLRTERGQRESAGREAFSRCAKSLIVRRGEHLDLSDRPLGMPLELLALRHPSSLGEIRTIPVQILFQGKPLAGALLRATWEQDPTVKLAVRSDETGQAVFDLPRAGVWLVCAVHMTESEPGSEVDWESLWASLTFEVPVDPSLQGRHSGGAVPELGSRGPGAGRLPYQTAP